MFNRALKRELAARTSEVAAYKGLIAALDRSMAIVEFSLDGKVLRANDNFLNAMGYRADQVSSMSHRDFCSPVWCAMLSTTIFGVNCEREHLCQERFNASAGKGGVSGWKLAITP